MNLLIFSGNRKKIIIFASLILLCIAIPLTVWFAHQQQTIKQKASELPLDQQVVAYIGQKMITKDDILTQLHATYGNNIEGLRDSKEYENAALEAILYRNILEIEAKRNNIVLSSEEINANNNNVLESFNSSESASSLSFDKLQQQDLTLSLLEHKLEEKVVSHKLIDMVLIYMSVETSTVQENEQAKSFFAQIRDGLAQSKDTQQAVDDVVGFDNLKPLLTVSSKRVLLPTNTWDSVFKDAVASMHKGDVSPVLDSQGGTFLVVRVVDEITTPFTSFDQWYQAQRRNLVILPAKQ